MRAAGAAFFAAALLVAPGASAHQVGLSRGTYRLTGAQLDAEVVFQNGELAAAAAGADGDKNGALSDEELKAGKGALEGAIVEKIEVSADGKRCVGSLVGARLVEGDGVELRAHFVCPSAPRELVVEQAFLKNLSHGHRQLSSLGDGVASVDAVTFAGSSSLRLSPGAPAPAASGAGASAGGHGAAPGLGGLFLLGVEHILTGYDHLVFLLGLVLIGGRFRSLLGVVTAFTVAHSITLALAALGVWAPSPRLVEPAIALSIAYVGVENFFAKSAEGRWRITFPFGLIHGFGFAGALAEVALPRAQVPAALLLFNLGVEAGQLAVMAPLLLALHGLGKLTWFRRHGVRAVSVAVVVAGVAWFIERVRGA